MKRHTILIGALALLLTGCETCNRCDDHIYGSVLFHAVYVARFPANDPALAVRVGKALGKDCLGEVEAHASDPYVWIYAKSEDEAACIRKALAPQVQVGRLEFVNRGQRLPWENSGRPPTRSTSNAAP